MGFIFKGVKKVVGAVVGVASKLVGGILGPIIGAFSPKQKKPSNVSRLNKRLEPEEHLKIVFGKTASALDVRYWEVWGAKGTNFDEVIGLACHTITSAKEFFLEQDLAINAAGVVQAPYVGVLSREVKLGLPGQTALSVGAGVKYGPTAKFTGMACMALKWVPDEKKLPNGIPSRYTQVIEGAPVYDPRRDTTAGGAGAHRIDDQSTWEYLPLDSNGVPIGRNNALQVLWYLIGWRIANVQTGEKVLVAGRGVLAEDINMSTFIAAANACEAAGYYTDAILSTEEAHTTNEDKLTAEGLIGRLIDTGGLWSYYANVDDTANIAVELTDTDIIDISSVKWNEYGPIGDQYTAVGGKFVDPSQAVLFQPNGYPLVRDATYEAGLNGLKKRRTVDFEVVQDVALAQKLARLELNQGQYQGEFSAGFMYRAMAAQAWSIARYTSERYGWVKLFRIWRFDMTADSGLGLLLKEVHPSIWTAGSVVQPAAPGLGAGYNARQEIAATGVGIALHPVIAPDGTKGDGFRIFWDAPGVNVRRTEIRYQLVGSAYWETAGPVLTDVLQVIIAPLLSGAIYTAAVRHISMHEVPGPWVNVADFQLGTTGNVNFTAIAAAGGTAVWANVTGAGKPADNATVGAPSGTPVGSKTADEVASSIDSHTATLASQGVTLSDIIVDVDDLYTTYGSTASAAASAAAASTSASAATSAEIAVTSIAKDLLPSDFAQDGKFWTSTYTANPSPVLSGWTFITNSSWGRMAQTTAYRVILPNGYYKFLPGRRLKVTAFWQLPTANTAGTPGQRRHVYLPMYDGDKNYVNRTSLTTSVVSSGLDLVQETWVFDTDPLLAIVPNAAFARPQIEMRDGASGGNFNGDFRVLILKIEDITEATNAVNSATAAATSASTATTKAGEAGASATTATTQANNAATSAGNAASSASSAAASSATATSQAALATQSAVVAASVGQASLNKNPSFSDWPVGQNYPTNWGGDIAGAIPTKIASSNGSNAVRAVGAINADAWFSIGNAVDQLVKQNEWYVIEADVRLNGGDFNAAGVLFRSYNSSMVAVKDLAINFATDKDVSNAVIGAGVVGKFYRFRKLVQVTAATAERYRLFAMTHWGTLGSRAVANDITWEKCLVRPASDAEIATQRISPLEATVSTHTGALATVQGRSLAYLQQVVNAGAGTTAFVELRAETSPGVETSSVGIGAREVHVYNLADGLYAKALSIQGGNVIVYGDLQIGGSISVGNNRIAIALQSFNISVYDGQVVDYGGSVGNLPILTPDFSGFPTLAAGESYIFRADNPTSTGFTARVKKTTSGTTTTQTSAAGTAGSGGPTLVTHKPTVADASDGTYTFRVTGNMQRTGETLSEPPITVYSGWIDVQTWFKLSAAGAWVLGPVARIKPGPGADGVFAYDRTFSVAYGGAIGQHTSQEFGVSLKAAYSPGTDTLTGLTSVSYTTLSGSTETTATPGNLPLLPVKVEPQNG